MTPASGPEADARLAQALLAVDPQGLGGAAVQSASHEAQSGWVAGLRALLPATAPWRRLPLHADTTALVGGLDLGASLQRGRPVAQPGLLAQADGGWVLLPLAERTPAHMAAQLSSALDRRELLLEREGLALTLPARIGLVALDQGDEDGEHLPTALLERLAFHLRLTPEPEAPTRGQDAPGWTASDIAAAQSRLAQVAVPHQWLEALCAASLALGVGSMRAPLMAVRAARALAALEGAAEVDEAHASAAARLVLAPRATQVPSAAATDEPDPAPSPETDPAAPQASQQTDPADPPPSASQAPPPAAPAGQPATPSTPPPSADANPTGQPAKPDDATPEEALPPQALQELLVQAALAALPPGLLAALRAGQAAQAPAGGAGRAGAVQQNLRRGRPVGTRRGDLRSGARLHLLDTLRAAAPWQPLRQRHAPPGPGPRVRVQREDFHVRRFQQHRATTTVFVVDASGSSALHRLAEAKGAVELLLAECYVRRDRAAVVAFRGAGAEVVLPPTRSLARAKRSLAALPGGGGTPLASGLEAAHAVAAQVSRQGETPVVVVLTDGRANLGRDGRPGRVQAMEDALAAAQALRAGGVRSLLIDTSAQPQPAAQAVAARMGAQYIPLPHAGAHGLSQVVRAAATRT